MSYELLIEDFVSSVNVPPGRKAWVLPPPAPLANEPEPEVIVLLDAELYIERVSAASILREMQEAGAIPRAVCVFVSCVSWADRHVDYTCNPAYTRFLAEELSGWVATRYSEAERTATIVGLSLSGLAAAFAALQYPEQFPTAICQSPSFWWNDQWLSRSSGQPGRRARFWVSVGDRETDENVTHGPTGMVQKVSQIEGCRQMCELMRVRGIEVNERTFAGGHDPDRWREDLRVALPWSQRMAI